MRLVRRCVPRVGAVAAGGEGQVPWNGVQFGNQVWVRPDICLQDVRSVDGVEEGTGDDTPDLVVPFTVLGV